jgi:hypothetical protein
LGNGSRNCGILRRTTRRIIPKITTIKRTVAKTNELIEARRQRTGQSKNRYTDNENHYSRNIFHLKYTFSQQYSSQTGLVWLEKLKKRQF